MKKHIFNIMSKIIYIPLENLPQRYTEMMNNALYLKTDIALYPKIEIDKQIKRGQFLDIEIGRAHV